MTLSQLHSFVGFLLLFRNAFEDNAYRNEEIPIKLIIDPHWGLWYLYLEFSSPLSTPLLDDDFLSLGL